MRWAQSLWGQPRVFISAIHKTSLFLVVNNRCGISLFGWMLVIVRVLIFSRISLANKSLRNCFSAVVTNPFDLFCLWWEQEGFLWAKIGAALVSANGGFCQRARSLHFGEIILLRSLFSITLYYFNFILILNWEIFGYPVDYSLLWFRSGGVSPIYKTDSFPAFLSMDWLFFEKLSYATSFGHYFANHLFVEC